MTSQRNIKHFYSKDSSLSLTNKRKCGSLEVDNLQETRKLSKLTEDINLMKAQIEEPIPILLSSSSLRNLGSIGKELEKAEQNIHSKSFGENKSDEISKTKNEVRFFFEIM